MYVCTCTRVCAHAHVCVHMRAYVCTCTRMCAHVCVCVHMRVCMHTCVCMRMYWKDHYVNVLLAYQKNLTTERNQLAYLEISECCMLEDDVRVPAALPNVVHSVSLLEQWIGERSLPTGELNIHGRLVANSSLYKYAKLCSFGLKYLYKLTWKTQDTVTLWLVPMYP